MARINRVPRGLTSLLGTKALGQNPQSISETVTPTVDLTEFYQTEQTLVSDAAAEVLFTPSIGNFYATVTVPNGEAWFIYNITTKMVAAANISVAFVPCFILADNIANVQHQVDNSVFPFNLTTTNQGIVARDYDKPRLVSAGTQIASYCANDVTPGTNNLTVITSVAYVPVDI